MGIYITRINKYTQEEEIVYVPDPPVGCPQKKKEKIRMDDKNDM